MKKVSIVTIVRNDSAGLEKTVKSVTAQTFQDYEFIIIDGASTDSTPDIINAYKAHFSITVSEPDKGIYDAMNKGIANAGGEYIIFMNAGDIFASEKALEEVFSATEGSPDVIYGDYLVDYGYTERHIKGLPQGEIWKGMLTSHQSTLVRRELMQKNPFDIRIKIGADFDRLFRLSTLGCVFLYIPVTVAVIEPGGVSDRKRVRVYEDHFRSIRRYGRLNIKVILFYAYIITDCLLRQWAKSILPEKAVRRLIKCKADS